MNTVKQSLCTFTLVCSILMPYSECIAAFMHNTLRKKILILSSQGGHGHENASQVLQEILGRDYKTAVAYPIQEGAIIPWLPAGGEGIYDYLLRNNWVRLLNCAVYYPVSSWAGWSTRIQEARMTKIVNRENPDFVISVIPGINYTTSKVCKALEIPFLLVTLDPELTFWLAGFTNQKHPHCVITVPDYELVKDQLTAKGFLPEQIHTVGYPLKKSFFKAWTNNDLNILRDRYKIPEHTKVVMLMRGSSGSNKLITYANTLLTSDSRMHLVICAGKNENLKKQLETALKPTANVTFSVLGFTTDIPGLMKIAHTLVTAPSPNTCNEAIHSNLAILIDNTDTMLRWEKPNITFIKKYGRNVRLFNNNDELKSFVEASLPPRKKKHRPLPNFNREIKGIVKLLLKEDAPRPESMQ